MITADRRRAIDLYNHAIRSAADHKSLAYQTLSSSVTVDPTLAQAWVQLGASNANAGMLDSGIACWLRALDCPADREVGSLTMDLRIDALVGMVNALHHAGRNAEARVQSQKLLRLIDKSHPRAAAAYTNHSLLDTVDGLLDRALDYAERAYAADPNYAPGEVQLAFALMHTGDYARGLRHFEARFPYRLEQFKQYPYPQWKGEPGKRLFVVSEQGIGDTLSFARFLPLAAACSDHVHAHVHPESFAYLRLAFKDLANLTLSPAAVEFPPADYWSSFVSLPTALNLSNEQIINCPGLPVPPLYMSKTWKERRAKFHIGVAWAGSNRSDNNKWKKFPIEHLYSLYRVPGIQLYGLQCDEAREDIARSGGHTLIRDLSPYTRSVLDTLAILADLDLVITTESALGHIAGLVNRPCWIPYAYYGLDYRPFGHDGARGALWYPKHRFFKQGASLDWGPVFAAIVSELQHMVREHGKTDAGRNGGADDRGEGRPGAAHRAVEGAGGEPLPQEISAAD